MNNYRKFFSGEKHVTRVINEYVLIFMLENVLYFSEDGREVEVRDGPFDKTMGRIIGLEASGALRLAVHGRETVCRSGSVYPVNGPRAT